MRFDPTDTLKCPALPALNPARKRILAAQHKSNLMASLTNTSNAFFRSPDWATGKSYHDPPRAKFAPNGSPEALCTGEKTLLDLAKFGT